MRTNWRALLVGSIALAAGTARATPARVVGLGDLGRYVEDDTNVLSYPGLINRYSHLMYIDLGGPAGVSPGGLSEIQSTGMNGGAYIRLSDGLHLGVLTSAYANNELNGFVKQLSQNSNGANSDVFKSMLDESTLRRYDVILGYGTSKDFGAGLRLSYGSTSETYNPSELEKTADGARRDQDFKAQRQLRATAGVSTMLDGGSTLDASLDYSYYGLTYVKNAKDGFVGGAGNGIGVSARGRFVLSRFWDLIPQVAYRGTFFALREDSVIPAFGAASNDTVKPLPHEDGKPKAERVHSRAVHDLDLGAAAQLRASKVATFWIAAGMRLNNTGTVTDIIKDGPKDETDSASNTLYSLPYVKFAVEVTPFEWLKLRAAAEKYSWNTSSSSTVDDQVANNTFTQSGSAAPNGIPDFNTYVGASFLLQGFTLDLLVDNEFLKRGPSFVSGAQGNLAARASLAYKF